MSKQQEALRLALEALELNDAPLNNETIDLWERKTDAAITAIREALAEQPAQQQESVYHLRQFGDVTKEQLDRYIKTGNINPQSAQQQEPFEYLWPTGIHPEFRYTQQKRDGVDGTPVYTSSPASKPLTDEQILHRVDTHVGGVNPGNLDNSDWIQFARAIEAAHGITGEQK